MQKILFYEQTLKVYVYSLTVIFLTVQNTFENEIACHPQKSTFYTRFQF